MASSRQADTSSNLGSPRSRSFCISARKICANPSEKLWNAYSRIAKYLVKTRDFKLVYGTPDIELMDLESYGHSDSDWGGWINDEKSTGVYIFLLLGAAIRWKVKLSQTARSSSQEAEYCALSEGTKEALNLRMLMQQLGFGSMKPTTIFCDNDGPTSI